MAGSTLIEVAESVKTALNATSFVTAFTAVRKAFVHPKLEDITADLAVYVVPFAERSEKASRNSKECEYDVMIGVAQKVVDYENSTVDPLTLLCEQIGDYFDTNTFPDRDERWIKSEVQPYSPQHLHEQNTFLSTIKLTFLGTR